MLQILQTKNFERYTDEIKSRGILDKFPNVVEAVDGEKILGTGMYHFENNELVLDKIEAEDDLYLYDGIVRAILFLAMMKGIDTARFELQNLEFAKKLGFVKNDNTLEPISEFMSACKNCKK